jgi:hypothetical protein
MTGRLADRKHGSRDLTWIVNGWKCFWEDFHSDQLWRYPESPPDQLRQSLGLEPARVNHGEMIRAEWMWARRPKSVLLNDNFGYALLLLGALLLLFVPFVGIFLTVLWCILILSMVGRDSVRLLRWRREYEVSVTRILAHRCGLK